MGLRCSPSQPSFLYLLMSCGGENRKINFFEWEEIDYTRASEDLYIDLSLGCMKGTIDCMKEINVFTS